MTPLHSNGKAATWAVVALAVCALTVLVARYDALLVVAFVLAPMLLAFLCLRPELATVAAVFILYSNLTVVWSHSVPVVVSAALLAALLAIPLAYHVVVRGERLKWDTTCVLLLLLFGALLASSLVAVDPWIAGRRVVMYVLEGAVLYWLVLNVIRTRETLRRVMAAVVLAAAFLGTLSLYQGATGTYHQQFSGLAQLQSGHEMAAMGDQAQAAAQLGATMPMSRRSGGPVGDPNRYAQILLVAAPFAVYLCWQAASLAGRAVWAGGAMLVLLGVGLTYSRGAFVTSALMLLVLAAWRYVRPSRLAAAGLVLALVAPVAAPRYVERMATLVGAGALLSDNPTQVPDRVIRSRATEMLASLLVFRDHPILGVGPGQYLPFYSQKYQAIDAIEFRDVTRPRRAHTFLELAAELGAVGLALFVAIVWLLLSRIARARRYWMERDPMLGHLAAAVAFSLIAYVGTALFLHVAYERYFWFLLGTAGAAVQVLWREAERETVEAIA